MATDKFKRYLEYERRYSTHTLKAYQKDIEQFFSFLKDVYAIESAKLVNQAIIRSWIISLKEESISTRTINRKISCLKTFFSFLIKESEISNNPMLKILSPKTSKKLPTFIEEEKMEILFDEVDFGEGFEAARDRLILDIFYSTGIRLSELINLKSENIDFKKFQIKVLGKRNKERIIPFSKGINNLILNYITLKNNYFNNKITDSYLFLSKSGKKAYPKLIYRVVNKYLSKITTLKKLSPHVLRHTFATHMLNNGADLNAIKELLGHSNLSATQIYTHNSIDKLKKVYKHAHPRA
ncbi:MAG: tyrosine-type recombinase/integrase [Bacteroidales bacterium]|nr:tyrosine-type recombinase/integrase [Bacteroidales bacterium]